MKKATWLAGSMAVLALTACADQNTESETNTGAAASDGNVNQADEENSEANNEAGEEETVSEDALEIEFWHAMGGGLGDTLEELVADYNASQDQYVITPEYQGSYEELLTQYRTVGGTETAPGLVQMFEVGTKYMIDSGYITPVQEWIDRENYDISQLEENILTYYMVDDELYSMPFNSSTPVLMYNKDMFEAAGLDPDNPPETFSEIAEAARALTNEDTYGFSMLGHGWFFEQMISTQGVDFVNNDNGRSDLATEATFGGEEGLRVFEWLSDMTEEGTMNYYGRDWDDIRAAFQNEDVAMYMDSSAGITGAIDNAPFEIGASFVPHADEIERNGVIIGGASVWMSDGISEEEQAAAFDFMRWFNEAETQADWHMNTGYFATNPAAYELDRVVEAHEDVPQLTVPITQLQETIPSSATQGALISVFPESREQVVTALEALYQGTSPEDALNQAVEGTNRAIEVSNRAAE
ncbi:ABC transporter substrate-binding protein [Salisediminibacterium selenitireducens]|uniref:Extracellular solute-binding protein family 1 n=1 Tax=Bacillus selenitireducens (strain ATCC 700615 / DSM 15326 / MLS10) TaxID=439292 RepID=D6XZA5_BACIE|nr:ABC transporter substrate-binding protein [Salisediminibacterium selenitireducens]ADI00390.1 extracellular solute-binding protein family 1 [[Bacillus] selenitireducens MLS10]